MKELWKDIEGYEGRYQVSSLGRIKSLRDNHGNYREKILDIKPNKCGYKEVRLSKNSKKKPYLVHRLVAIHFISNPNNYPQINHKDENKSNNCVSNLEWCTQKYNNNYGTHNKKISEKFKGVNNHRYGTLAVNRRKVQCITTGKKFNSIKEASDYYSVNRVTISECCKGKRKSSGKHPVTGEKLIWRYLD